MMLFFIYLNPSQTDPAPIRDPNLVIAMLADALALHSARPSASTIRAEDLKTFSLIFF